MPTLADVRTKYPQYKDVPDAKLADALHDKFYSHVPLEKFHQAIGYDPAAEAEEKSLKGQGWATPLEMGLTYGQGPDIDATVNAAVTGEENLVRRLTGRPIPYTAGEAFSATGRGERKAYEEFREQHPYITAAEEVGSGLVSPVTKLAGLLAAPAEGSTFLMNVLRGGAVGGGFGAAVGEGTAGGNVNQRVGGAIPGAALGTLLGGGLTAAGPPLTELGLVKANSMLRRMGRRGWASLERPARDVVATTNEPATKKAVELLAHKLLTDTLGKHAPTPGEMLEQAAQSPTKEMTLLDVTRPGSRTRGFAGSLVRSPKGPGGGELATFLGDRSKGQGPRLEADIQRHIGAGSSRQTIKALMEQQKAAANVTYGDAFEANPVIRSSVVDQLVRDSKYAPLWRIAQQEARSEVAGTDKPIPDKYSLRTLDKFKQLLFEKGRAESNAWTRGTDTMGRAKARATNAARVRLINELDTLDRSPGGLYAKGRNTFAGDAASIDAIEFGRDDALKMSAEEIKEKLQNMTEGERDLARLGLAETLRNREVRGLKVGANTAANIALKPALQDQLRPVFSSPREFQAFLNDALAEDTMFNVDKEITRGSATAARLAEDQSDEAQAAGHGGRAAAHLLRHNLPFGAFYGLRALQSLLGWGPDAIVGSRAADILQMPVNESGLARQMLESMARTAPDRATRDLLRARIMREALSRMSPVGAAETARATTER